MNEDFLAYVWKHQYFDKTELQTTAGEPLAVLQTGQQNTDAGPDFLSASLLLDGLTWAGSVELHVKASDWMRHRHTTDRKYDQVILHVVWENDAAVTRTNGTAVPVLELKERVAPELLQTYLRLKQPKPTIPCEPFLNQVREITKTAMQERTLLERLELKATGIREKLKLNGNDWEATTFQVLMGGFGFKINQQGFNRLAKELPFRVLQKHRHRLFQVEALLMGQSGFLAEPTAYEYIGQLQQEYAFLQHKHQLPAPMHRADWNFLRLRPANFPTVRLAQLAALFHLREHWFGSFTTFNKLADLVLFFQAKPSGYWAKHYLPGRESKSTIAPMGKSSINLLLINVVAPLLVAYARETDQPELVEKAVTLLEKLKPEQNHILSMYEDLQFENRTAAQSQGLLALYHGYCTPVRCLLCAIGAGILKRAKVA